MPNTDALNRTVFISDNLPFLKSLDTESIDLVVIDPPFGKKQTFTGRLRPPLSKQEREQEQDLMVNWGVFDVASAYELGVEYPDQTGETALFREMWRFERVLQQEWWDAVRETPIWWLIESTRRTHDEDTAAYIAFMAQRMVELRRILKPTGSVYLHCDHDANAYLRQMMDAVFGANNFRNEIIWSRSPGRSAGNMWGNTHDTILYYTKSQQFAWKPEYTQSENTSPTRVPLTAAGVRHGESGQAWQGYNPTSIGRHWGVPRTGSFANWIDANIIEGYARIGSIAERLDALDNAGLIVWSENRIPSIMRPPEADLGVRVNDIWADISLLSPTSRERTGYPTQKPQALAQRIIQASSNPGDLVLDCFAGCAYVPVAAEMLGRRWIACDMSPRAWTIVRRQFAKKPELGMTTEGEETDYEEASPRFEGKGILKVRGPRELPLRSDPEMRFEYLPPRAHLPQIRFRQTPLETSAEIWQAFVDEWGTECWYCGRRQDADRRSLQLDHVEPNKGDGSNDDCWNRALACAPCNSDKSDRLTPTQAIDKALAAGRIQTPAQRDEICARFSARRAWARNRWDNLPKKPPLARLAPSAPSQEQAPDSEPGH